MTFRPLILALALLSTACTDIWGPLCVFMCTNSTKIQRSYTDISDTCRQLADLKAQNMQPDKTPDNDPTMTTAAADKAARARQAAAFSECMNNNAWAVPSGDDKKKDAAPAAPAAAPAGPVPPPPAPAPVMDAQRKRAADCAFARQAADSSIISKKRAEACDLECKQQLDLAPGAPKPATCP